MIPQALTVAEALSALRISRAAFYLLVKRGELSTFKIGRSRRVTSEALAAFIAARETA